MNRADSIYLIKLGSAWTFRPLDPSVRRVRYTLQLCNRARDTVYTFFLQKFSLGVMGSQKRSLEPPFQMFWLDLIQFDSIQQFLFKLILINAMHPLSRDASYLWRLEFENRSWQNWPKNGFPAMERKFWEIRILGMCTAVDNFAHPSQRRHGNQNMKSSLYQPTPFFLSRKVQPF